MLSCGENYVPEPYTQLYRIEGRITVSMSTSEHDDYGSMTTYYNIYVDKYNVLCETKEGYWIDMGITFRGETPVKKWVGKSTRKRFAYPTEKEAYESFIARKKRQISILKNQIEAAQEFLHIAKEKYNHV